MMDFIKKFDRKFLITCGCLIICPLLLILILMMLRGCSNSNKVEDYQEQMVTKAKAYFKYHELLPTKEGKEQIVTLDELVEDGFKIPDKALGDSSCTGSVTVKKNGKNYFYIPYLECSEYTTDYIINHVKKDVVTSESGLYKVGEEYIYKGNKVNNYLSLNGVLYRIIKVDSDGNLRLIKNEREANEISWDNKYNTQSEENIGINNYYNSLIYDRLWESYKTNDKYFNNKVRKHLIAFDVCLDKKKLDDNSFKTVECENVLEDQFITIPSLYDYVNASYDSDCDELNKGACSNFNYLDDVISSSWTINAVSDNTSDVYYIASSDVLSQNAVVYKGYYWVITISGNELYSSGNGTLEKPYVVN